MVHPDIISRYDPELELTGLGDVLTNRDGGPPESYTQSPLRGESGEHVSVLTGNLSLCSDQRY